VLLKGEGFGVIIVTKLELTTNFNLIPVGSVSFLTLRSSRGRRERARPGEEKKQKVFEMFFRVTGQSNWSELQGNWSESEPESEES